MEIVKLWEKDADYLRSIGCTSLQSDDVRVAVFAIHYDGKSTGLIFDVYIKKDGSARMFGGRIWDIVVPRTPSDAII